MNPRTPSPIIKAQLQTFLHQPASRRPIASSSTLRLARRFASGPSHTHQQRPDSTVNPQAGTGSNANFGPERVGPFPMGVGMGGSVRTKTWRKWSELGLGGKAIRMTAQSGNLAVVVIGGTVFLLLAYSLTSELFSRSSPTVLLNQAISIIEDSESLDPHLLRPYSFTHMPSATSSRRTSPVQSQLIRNPQTGHDHLVVRFWIHGRGIDEQDTTGWMKARWRDTKLFAKKLIRDLGSDSVGGVNTADAGAKAEESTEKARATSGGWFSGWFGVLRPSLPRLPAPSLPKKALPPAGTYKTGECHADYFKDETGAFRLLTLTVDVPSSRVKKQRAVVHWEDPEEVGAESVLEGRSYKITW